MNFKERVLEEYTNLVEKRVKLRCLINQLKHDTKERQDYYNYDLLCEQHDIMIDYEDILIKRLKVFINE